MAELWESIASWKIRKLAESEYGILVTPRTEFWHVLVVIRPGVVLTHMTLILERGNSAERCEKHVTPDTNVGPADSQAERNIYQIGIIEANYLWGRKLVLLLPVALFFRLHWQ